MKLHTIALLGLLSVGTAWADGEGGRDGAAQWVPFSTESRGTRGTPRAGVPRAEVQDLSDHFSEAMGSLSEHADRPGFVEGVLKSFQDYDPATAIRESVTPRDGSEGLSDAERVRLYHGFVSVVEAAGRSSDPAGLARATREVLDSREGPALLERQARGEGSLLAAAQDRIDPSYAETRARIQALADHSQDVLTPLFSLPPEELPRALERARARFRGADYERLRGQVVGPDVPEAEFKGAMEATDRLLGQIARDPTPRQRLESFLAIYDDPDFAASAAAWQRRPVAESFDAMQRAAEEAN